MKPGITYEYATLEIIDGDTHCYDFHLDKVVEAIRKWMLGQLA